MLLISGVQQIGSVYVFIGSPGGASVKNLPAIAGGLRNSASGPGLGRPPGGGPGNPLQCSCLKNSMDRGTRQSTVHRIAQSRT